MSPVLRYSVLIGSVKRCPTCEIKLRKMLLFKIKSLTLHSKYINNVYITIMLESLTLKNFLSFRDETIFDFTATTEKPKVGYEHIDWYTPLNKKKILKTIDLYQFSRGNKYLGKNSTRTLFFGSKRDVLYITSLTYTYCYVQKSYK